MKHLPTFSSIALVAGILSGCASTGPSSQLVDARKNYKKAQSYNDIAPDRVYEAKQALKQAEAVHDDEAGSSEEKHYAYIADREAQKAIAIGEQKRADMQLVKADSEYDKLQSQRLSATAEHLEHTSRALQQSNEALQRKDETIAEQQARLKAEREARLKAEKQAALAIDSLKKVAQVKETAKEVTITLSGAVLFRTGEHELLPVARGKLDEVASALKQLDENRVTVVEGHTDSRGAEDMNRELSLQRAQSVRTYLVSQGVDPARIRAVGQGESEPVASNDSAEGRANNRRVELVIREQEPNKAPVANR